MKILCDYLGHSDLFYSMHCLFEKRLGWELYRPSSHDADWEKKVGLFTSTFPPEPLLSKEMTVIDGVEYNHSQLYNFDHKSISFDKFLEMDFDVIVTTGWMNEAPFMKIKNDFKPKLKVVRQIANIGEKPICVNNILLATAAALSPSLNIITHYPEHLDVYNSDFENTKLNSIKSFYNDLPNYSYEVATWNQLSSQLPSYDFKMHGRGGTHEAVLPAELPDCMREAAFIYHAKPMGNCGYTARQALFSGKPLIVKGSYSKIHKTLAMNYLQPGINCIDLEIVGIDRAIRTIKEWTVPEVYKVKTIEVSDSIRRIFDFNKNAEEIKNWIERL